MNDQVKRQINQLPSSISDSIKSDYRKGTGLTVRDLIRKYGLNYAVICYIVKKLD